MSENLIKRFLLFFTIVLIFACILTNMAKVSAYSSKYILSAGDKISISVGDESDLKQDLVFVAPDGYATIEPFGQLKVSGLAIEELSELLKQKYEKFYINPVVSVDVLELKPIKVNVIGAVERPGMYKMSNIINNNGDVKYKTAVFTLVNALQQAGGAKFSADLSKVVIENSYSGKKQVVNLLKVLNTGDASEDIRLNNGDNIKVAYLPEGSQFSNEDFELLSGSSVAPVNYTVKVTGSVNKPGLYTLDFSTKSINSALALAGGYKLGAKQNLLKIHRVKPNGEYENILINPMREDIALRPNDLVEVFNTASYNFTNGVNVIDSVMEPVQNTASASSNAFNSYDPYRRNRLLIKKRGYPSNPGYEN